MTNGRVARDRYPDLPTLLKAVRACRACERHLPQEPRPVLQAETGARLLIVGQAPGARVHASGIPWDDPSGERLRTWLGLPEETFYDPGRTAIIPMGYCYPGRGRSGDNPPRAECAELWLGPLLEKLPQIRLTLLIGQYAQRHFLRDRRGATLTGTVRSWRELLPGYIPLPHPSPRNRHWLTRNPWFDQELVPELRRRVAAALGPTSGAARKR